MPSGPETDMLVDAYRDELRRAHALMQDALRILEGFVAALELCTTASPPPDPAEEDAS